MELSQSKRHRKLVQHIDFGFDDLCATRNATHVREMMLYLSTILTNIPDVRALEFNEPRYMTQEDRVIYMETVASALRWVPFSNLVKLSIEFPITNDFGRFCAGGSSIFQIPMEVMQNIRDLELHASFLTDRVERPNNTVLLPSAESRTYPNHTHAANLFKLVESSPNLQSLGIQSANFLDMDRITWPSSIRLQSLKLEGISAPSHSLLAIIHQSAETLDDVHLWMIHLESGTWLHLLLEMGKLVQLTNCVVDDCGYSPTGHSAYWIPDDEEIWTKQRKLNTRNVFDLSALEVLLRKVNERRIYLGYEPFPEWTFHDINPFPLESMWRYALDLEALAMEVVHFLNEHTTFDDDYLDHDVDGYVEDYADGYEDDENEGGDGYDDYEDVAGDLDGGWLLL